MKRKKCTLVDNINLLYAQEADRHLIYDISVKNEDIVLSMFENPDDFRWEDIRDEHDEFFNEIASLNKYLLIECEGEIIGVFYHTFHLAPVQNVEFHIWFVSTKFTGRGFGTKVVSKMKEYIHSTYNISTFIMRPWIKNPQAVRTYEKCGFEVKPDFELSLFFSAEEIAMYGNGAYTPEETINMVAYIGDR